MLHRFITNKTIEKLREKEFVFGNPFISDTELRDEIDAVVESVIRNSKVGDIVNIPYNNSISTAVRITEYMSTNTTPIDEDVWAIVVKNTNPEPSHPEVIVTIHTGKIATPVVPEAKIEHEYQQTAPSAECSYAVLVPTSVKWRTREEALEALEHNPNAVIVKRVKTRVKIEIED